MHHTTSLIIFLLMIPPVVFATDDERTAIDTRSPQYAKTEYRELSFKYTGFSIAKIIHLACSSHTASIKETGSMHADMHQKSTVYKTDYEIQHARTALHHLRKVDNDQIFMSQQSNSARAVLYTRMGLLCLLVPEARHEAISFLNTASYLGSLLAAQHLAKLTAHETSSSLNEQQ